MELYLYAAAVAALIGGYVFFRLRRRGVEAGGKVVKLSRVRAKKKKDLAKARSGGQPCSSCRKQVSRLNFYADESGRIVGVCRDCKAVAERRQLNRL